MPFIKRVVSPLYVSRSTDTNICEDNSILTRDNSELIAVNNCTLSNAIRQLASLAGHAEEIFAELRQELGEVNARATSIKQRICQLEGVAEKLDARTVTVPESDLDSFYRRSEHYSRKHEIATGLFSASSRTPALRRMYEAAGTTPVPAMRELDRLRRDGRRSSRIFMCTPVLGGTGPRRKRRMQLDDIETSKPASLTNIRPWKSSEVLGDTTAPPDVSSAPLVDTSALDGTAHQLPSPEEQCSAVARRFPGQVVVVDVSGRSFDRQQRNRRSLSQVDTSRSERHRKRRSRRRNTICGTSEAELIRQAADGESQPGSGDPDSPEIESSIHSLSSKRKITSSDKGAMGDRVLSHFNSLRQWGRQRLSRSVTRNKEENNIYESVRGRRRSQSSSPHNVSVRLRTNSGRKKEDAAVHSSSGNWSASSSARTSVESDQHRGSSCPPSSSSQATSIPVSSSSSNSLGRDSAVSIRRPKALSISSSISRTSESGTLTPELLLPHDIPFADSISSSCNDGETSSVYSCDTEGYYTSFHMDSGLKTLREEPLESSSNNTANNTNSSSNTTVCAQIVTKALTAENEYELFGKGSTSTTTSSAGTVCTTLLAPGKPSPPPRKSSLEQVSNKSDSNSDTDTIERRLRVKTALSSSRIPSMCVITPPPSDDESIRPSSQLSFHTLPRTNEKSSKVVMASGTSVDTLHVINANLNNLAVQNVLTLTEENIKKIRTPSPPPTNREMNNLNNTSEVSKVIEKKPKDVTDSPKKSDKLNSSPPLKATLLPFNIVGKMKEVLSNRKTNNQITNLSSPINNTPLAHNNNNNNKNNNSSVDGEYVTISEVQKRPNIIKDTEYVSLNELPCNSQTQQNRPISPADSGSGSSSSTKSPLNSLERKRRQGARVTLDSEGKVVYSSDSLKRKPKTSNTTFEPGPYVKSDPSPSPLPMRSTAIRPVVKNQQNNNISPITSPPMSPNSNRVIIRATGNKAADSLPRATVRASSGPISPKSNHPGAYVDMQATEKKAFQGKKENNLNVAPLIIAQTQEKQPTTDNINAIDPCQELNKIKRNESYRLAANFSSVLQAKQHQQNGEVKKQQLKQPPRITEEKTHQIINPNILGRRFYGAQIMVDPSKIISSNSNVTSRLQHHELQQHLLASQIAATSPKSRVTIPSDTEKARVLNSDMLPSAAMAGPSSPHRYYTMQRGAAYSSATHSPIHGGASAQYLGATSHVPQYRAPPDHQDYGSVSSPPPPAPYYWTLPSRKTSITTPQVQVHQSVPQPSWYHTVAGHNRISSPPCSPMRTLDTNHNVLKNQMFSTPTKNHSPQLPYCAYSPISSPKKVPDRQTQISSPTLSPSRTGSPNKPILSPPRSTMSAEELFAAIHRSKRRMNIKTNDDFSRSTSPTTSSASLSPGSSESSLGAAGNRHSWSPSNNDLISEFSKNREQGSPIRGQQRQSWAGDRLGPIQQTSRNVFKRLLLEKGSRTESKGRVSAVEQLMASKSSVAKPKEQKVMLPTMPSGLRSPASWRFNSPRSDVLSSTILEDTEDVSDSPTHSHNSLQQNMSPRHSKYYTPKTPLSPNTSRYNLTPAQASDFAANRSADYHKYLRNDLDRNYSTKSEMQQSLNYPNISPIRNHEHSQRLLKYAPSSSPPQNHPSSPRMTTLLSVENRKANPVVTQPPSPSKLSLETAL